MKQFSFPRLRPFVGNSVIAGITASALLVGVVWSTSLATQGGDVSTTVDTTNSDETQPPDSTPINSAPPDSTIDESTSSTSVSPDTTLPSGADSHELVAQIAALTSMVDDLEARLNDASATIEELRSRTSQLTDDGAYTGTVSPGQISPQLRVSDVAGKWPLDRTDGDLPISRVDTGFTMCHSDSRSYGVITVGAFHKLECVRVPK